MLVLHTKKNYDCDASDFNWVPEVPKESLDPHVHDGCVHSVSRIAHHILKPFPNCCFHAKQNGLKCAKNRTTRVQAKTKHKSTIRIKSVPKFQFSARQLVSLSVVPATLCTHLILFIISPPALFMMHVCRNSSVMCKRSWQFFRKSLITFWLPSVFGHCSMPVRSIVSIVSIR